MQQCPISHPSGATKLSIAAAVIEHSRPSENAAPGVQSRAGAAVMVVVAIIGRFPHPL